MPRWLIYLAVSVVVLSFVPIACIAKKRTSLSELPRIAPIQNMAKQEKFRPQREATIFADGRAMRPRIEGTVVHGRPGTDEAAENGRVDGAWLVQIPIKVDAAVIRRGQAKFNIYCAPCHGYSGYGDGVVHQRAEALQEGTWVPPTNLHTEQVLNRENGHLYNTIKNGVRNMPSYGSQIERDDRWAIVAYIRALERSQNARPEDFPPEQRASIVR